MPIGRFINKTLLDKFANYVGVQLYKQSTTIDGGNGKFELTYRCKQYGHVGCEFKMFSKKAAPKSKIFLLYRSGTHSCGHHTYSAEETDEEETDVEVDESEEANSEQGDPTQNKEPNPNVVIEEPADVGSDKVVETDDSGSRDEVWEPDEAEGSSTNMDEMTALVEGKGELMVMNASNSNYNKQQQNAGNGSHAAINNVDNKDRGAALEKMVQDGLGLVFKGLMVGPAELYFVSAAKNTGFTSTRTMLTLRLAQVHAALISMVEYKNGVRDSAHGQFKWPIPDFDHFVWAVRGLCISTFFPPVSQPGAYTSSGKCRRSNQRVEEPEEQNGKQQQSSAPRDNSAFSVLDLQHPILRLEELAADMSLSVQKHNGGRGQTRLIFEPLKTNVNAATRLHLLDDGATATLVEYQMNPNTKTISWKKKLGTQLVWTKVDPVCFRYALLGKAMDIFYPKGKQ